MVYESGFTTRRTYSTRPVVSSYTVSYPTVERVARVYKTSFPIYSSYTIPHVTHKRIVSGTRIVSSPVRVISSPTRIVSRVISSPSPVRVVRTTTRVVSSPERSIAYSYTPSSYYSSSYVPSRYVSSTYVPSSTYIPSSYSYTTPSHVYQPISRVYTRSVSPVRITTSPVRVTPSILKRIPPGYGERALTNYLNTEPFTTFTEETNRIRHRAESLVRELHAPVIRRARSCTPFPVTGYTYEPTSELAFDYYLARITNPGRHVAREAHNIALYPEPARSRVGKSHLASVRICGDKAYNVRRPMYESDKIRTDINLKSWYLRHPSGTREKKVNKKTDEKVEVRKVEAVEVEA